jgi:hypothetical protein
MFNMKKRGRSYDGYGYYSSPRFAVGFDEGNLVSLANVLYVKEYAKDFGIGITAVPESGLENAMSGSHRPLIIESYDPLLARKLYFHGSGLAEADPCLWEKIGGTEESPLISERHYELAEKELALSAWTDPYFSEMIDRAFIDLLRTEEGMDEGPASEFLAEYWDDEETLGNCRKDDDDETFPCCRIVNCSAYVDTDITHADTRDRFMNAIRSLKRKQSLSETQDIDRDGIPGMFYGDPLT